MVGTFWYLAGFDGGFETAAVRLAGLGLLATGAGGVAVLEASRLPTTARILLAGWGLGALASLTFASVRSDFVHPALTYGLVPIVALSGMRLWRRRWGPGAVLLILLASLGSYWQNALWSWWGQILSDSPGPAWQPLSWHNQSSILMGALGVVFLGATLTGGRLTAAACGLASTAALAGCWLSGSRGGVAATALGITVTVLAALRLKGRRRPLPRLGAVLLSAVLLVGLLLHLPGGSGPTTHPLAARAEPVDGALQLRLDHIQAGLGMFSARPLWGHGLGSYGRVAAQFSSPSAHLTSSAHSEPAEALAEGGLAFGLPFIAAYLAAATLVALALLRPHRLMGPLAGPSEVRGPLALGAAGVVAALLLHGAADFDWLYPVLPALLALGVGILCAETFRPSEGRWWEGLVVVPVVALLGAGGIGAAVESLGSGPAPWDATAALSASLWLSGREDYEEAERSLVRAAAWNPGDSRLATVGAVLHYQAGFASPEDLTATLHVGRSPFSMFNLVAEVLIDGGDYAEARATLQEVLASYPSHLAWRPQGAARLTWALAIRLEGETRGCRSALQAGRRASADPLVGESGDSLARLARSYCQGQ
ncbi:MAG: O-antigen ligase family protein [Actinomycetota bacterium]|nr:O-antigen ligase family protein [Actinomycetota bacterium]